MTARGEKIEKALPDLVTCHWNPYAEGVEIQL
jgi:hypothetical protein